jgi:hypothetical protein
VHCGRLCTIVAGAYHLVTPQSRCRAGRTAAWASTNKEGRQVTGITEDDPLVQRIRDDVLRETGVELDQLMNPSKVRCVVVMCESE